MSNLGKKFLRSLKTDWPQYTGFFTVPWLLYRGAQSLKHMLKPEMPTLGQPQNNGIPSTAQGRVIPDILGTCKLSGSYIWYDRKTNVPAFQKWDYIHPNSKATVFTYALALCRGEADAALTCLTDDTIKWAGTSNNNGADEYNEIDIGDGTVYFHFGDAAQESEPLAGGAGICYALVENVALGSGDSTANQVASMYWVIKRQPDVAYVTNAHHVVNTRDYNPAHAIAYILVEICGVSSDLIDDTTFSAAAETLYTENLGISICMDQEAEASEYVKRILSHIDGVLTFDPSLKKFTLNLKRDDVLTSAMDEITADELLAPPTMTRKEWIDSANIVTVEYLLRTSKTEPSGETSYNFADAAATFKNAAAMALMGTEKSYTAKYPLFTNETAASWIAHRLLRENSYPQAEFTLQLPRQYCLYSPGTLFRLTYPDYGLNAMVCRVVEIKESELTSGAFEVRAVEDPDYLGGLPNFTAPTSGAEDADNSGDLTPFDHVKLFEIPYHPRFEDSNVYGCGICCIPVWEGSEDLALIYYSVDGGSTYIPFGREKQLGVYGALTEEYHENQPAIDDEGFLVAIGAGADRIDSVSFRNALLGMNFALLGDEIIRFTTITHISGTTYRISGVIRGLYDSLRITHPAGTAFYWGYYLHTIENYERIGEGIWDWSPISVDLPLGANRYFKVVPGRSDSTKSGALSEATPISLNITRRRIAPLCPICLMANGESYQSTYATDIVLTWAARIKGDGAGQIMMGLAKAADWEGTFTVIVKVGGSVVRTATGIDAQTWTYTEAMNLADNGSLASSVTFDIYCVQDARQSDHYAEIIVTKA